MGRALLTLTVFLVVILNTTTTIYLLNTADELSTTARASSAEASICVNAPPAITVPCNTTIDQDETFTCQLTVQDENLAQNHNFSIQWPGSPLFDITPGGLINHTTTNDDVGTHTLTFIVDDNSGCLNAQDQHQFNFTVENINDPPELVQEIPDVELSANTTTLAFFLSDHFEDPDGDVLSFTSTIPGNPFTVTIGADSDVTISAQACEPEEQTIQFFAEDPYNESAESNLATITVTCPQDQDGGGGGQGGGGGGGGGGAGLGGECREDWYCLEWMQCLPDNMQWRHCYDLNGCEDPKFLKRACDYQGPEPICEENWLCEEWSECQPDGTRSRECEDLNECNAEIYKPPVEQDCEYVPENESERPIIETPAAIESEQFSMWLVFALLASTLLTIGVFRLYHEEVLRGLGKLLLLLSRKKEPELLLTQEEKFTLLERLATAEKKAREHEEWDGPKRYEPLTRAARIVFSTIARTPEEFTKEDLVRGLEKRKASDELESMLVNLFERVYAIEAGGLEYNKAFFYSVSEELRVIVCLLSEYSVSDLERELEDFPISDAISISDELFTRLVRIYRALQFGQSSFAREEYAALLHTYEDLPEGEQSRLYDETRHAFSLLRYSYSRASTT